MSAGGQSVREKGGRGCRSTSCPKDRGKKKKNQEKKEEDVKDIHLNLNRFQVLFFSLSSAGNRSLTSRLCPDFRSRVTDAQAVVREKGVCVRVTRSAGKEGMNWMIAFLPLFLSVS